MPHSLRSFTSSRRLLLLASTLIFAQAEPLRARLPAYPRGVLPTGTAVSTISPRESGPELVLTVDELTTCTSTTISWFYIGPELPMSIAITNVNVTQNAPPSSSTLLQPPPLSNPILLHGRQASSNGAIAQVVASNLDPASMNYTWSFVDVPQGWYRYLILLDQSSEFSSAQFFVVNGSDVSCLTPLITPSPTGSSSSSPSITPPPSSNSALGSSHKVNKGAIAGGVVGGLAVLAAAIAAFLFFRVCASSNDNRRSKSGGSPRGLQWRNLTSYPKAAMLTPRPSKSKLRPKGYKGSGLGVGIDPFRASVPAASVRAARHHSQSDSLGPILSAGSVSVLTGGSDEDVNSLGHTYSPYSLSPSEEKIASPMHHEMNAMSTSPTRTRSQTQESYTGLQTPPRSSMSHTPDIVPIGRSASSSSYGPSRKTTRKPVPQYTQTELDITSASQQRYRTSSRVDLNDGIEMPSISNQLQHKDSVASLAYEGPVHYLIPDMPLQNAE